MANFSVSEEFSVLAGPSLGVLLGTADGVSSFNYGIELGAAYDITEQIFVEARYSIGLANLVEVAPSGFSSKLSWLYIGGGCKF